LSEKICVIGLGHVGLPLAIKIAAQGRPVLGVDVDETVLASLRNGRSPFFEEGLTEMLHSPQVKFNFELSGFDSKISKCKTVIVTVGTPVKSNGEPILSHLEDCTKSLGKLLKKNQLLIYRSTIPPGTLRNRVKPILEEKSGLKAGIDFYLAYCPERLVEGVALREIVDITHVISGINEKSTDLAYDFFLMLGSKCVRVSKPEVAEMAKIIDNVYRDVNIGLANELSLACQELGVDVMESIQAANTSPRTKVLIPGGGVGGSCLNKDPHMLLWQVGKPAQSSSVIKSARRVNESMPGRFSEAISEKLGGANGRSVAVLGVAFKSGTDDVRNTITPSIVSHLVEKGFRVKVYDPVVPTSISRKLVEGEVVEDLSSALKNASAVVICSDHAEFRNLDLANVKKLVSAQCLLADGRNLFEPSKVRHAGLDYVAIGRFES
jgi:dTDP-alpha-D-glucose dehydrogenase